MLKEISIRNFAIIDDLKIKFSAGLTILSGETGTGKSIILNAVNLLLGTRASTDLVRTGAENAELEGLFQIPAIGSIADSLSDHGYDAAEGLLIRRIISRSDGNRVYINGRLATIALLNTITVNLASISGQHAHQGLLKEDQHLLILDQYGGFMTLRQQIHDKYHQVLPLIEKLDGLHAIRQRQTEQIELLTFQQKEIITANPILEEDTDLENERLRLKNAESLYQTVYNSIEKLYGASGSVIEQILEVKKNLADAGRIDRELATKSDVLATAGFQIEDLVEELRAYLNMIEIDEQRLETVEERLDTLNKLKRKYGGSIEAVLSYLKSIEGELSALENIGEQIGEVEEKLLKLHTQLKRYSAELSKKRKKAAEHFARKVAEELGSLNMPDTRFEVLLRAIEAKDNTSVYLQSDHQTITEAGLDLATFMIAPNPGEELKPLTAIASGGELSRVVLALKALMAETASVETVIFDEVDAGIGGVTAEVVGRKLHKLARHHQIICITHLPQIAKFGERHFRITKHVAAGRTRTAIQPLNKKDRHREIARMLGGEIITQTTLDHARELLDS
jgi:DNA repair protein RecN (Recombination protein N)